MESLYYIASTEDDKWEITILSDLREDSPNWNSVRTSNAGDVGLVKVMLELCPTVTIPRTASGQRQGLSRWVVQAGWVVAAGVLLWMGLGPRSRRADPVRSYQIVLPDAAPLAFRGPAPLGIWQSSLAMSSDGR